jgi:2-desacetyl-2-hydroxyethyl bacteriochlorophyllide A dehydrogenase
MDNGTGANKSVVWDGNGGVGVESREVPEPGPGELRVRVAASGLCGTDLHIASGEYPLASPGVTLGHEFSGTVVEVGEGVDAFAEGDRIVVDPNIPCRVCRYCHSSRPHLCENPQAIGVTRDGGLSEFALIPAPQAYRVSDGLPDEAAALTEPLACALHAVDLGGLRPGDQALVLGAGPIGILCSMLLVAAGASEVLVSEPNADRRERIRRIGAEPLGPESVSEAMAERVFECVGRPETMRAAVEAARPGGTVMWVGVAPPDAEVPVKPYDVFSRELTIRGSYTNPYVMDRALAMLASGRLDWEVIVTHRFALEDFGEAWAAHREGAGLKISVQPETDTS